MAGYRNVTVALSPELLREARHLAVDRGVSLARFLALLLWERIKAASRFCAAQGRQRATMRQGFDLGTGGRLTWTRTELHER